MLRWIWALFPGLLIACNEPPIPSPATDNNNTNHYTTVLPQELTSYLETSFPQWRIVEKKDYSKTWWSFYDSSYNPCWARTDINDDRRADYAVWLTKDNQLRLVICNGRANKSFTHFIIPVIPGSFNEKEHDLSMGIAVAPPAQIDVVSPRIQSLILKSNGFALMELEERTRIFYWENATIQTFYMK
jgi:hypothetical protein